MPPEERSPAWVNDPVDGPVIKENIILFNAVLQEFVDSFETRHPETNVFTFDAHTWFNDILDNGSSYGFNNITGFVPRPAASLKIHVIEVIDFVRARRPRPLRSFGSVSSLSWVFLKFALISDVRVSRYRTVSGIISKSKERADVL